MVLNDIGLAAASIRGGLETDGRALTKTKLPSTKEWLGQFEKPFLTISCGEWTYGKPRVISAPNDMRRRLTIGRYCSIAENVRITVGRHGRHPLDTLTTYPVTMELDPERIRNLKRRPRWIDENLDVVIGDDVWIGSDVAIMAGVTIGTGAVLGAGAVIAKNVPPYAIVIGNPAKILRYRHDEETVRELTASRWWELEPEELWERLGEDILSPDMPSVIARLKASGAASAPSTPRKGPLAEKSLEELLAIFTVEKGANWPSWPAEDIQRTYTGGTGLSLLQRAENFIAALEKDGAFQNPNWKGLDYGCGWGRIASYMLRYGAPEQLELCDAWPRSLDLALKGGFRNKIFQVSEILKQGELPLSTYDFAYAMSIFTHLTKEAYLTNLNALVGSLKIGGKLYFTVRDLSFLNKLIQAGKVPPEAMLDGDGFWYVTYPGRPTYGEAVADDRFVKSAARPYGECVYIGSTESEQHLYRITREV